MQNHARDAGQVAHRILCGFFLVLPLDLVFKLYPAVADENLMFSAGTA
jgi:hypothetical protein